ncbi:unnamed protein product [Caenorhabditis brenneri]
MFKQLSLFIAVCAVVTHATMNLPSQEEYDAELKAAGMSQGGIDGLPALSQKFVSQYPLVQANKEASDKFIADYTVEAQNYVKSMSPEDQKIYAESLKKYGLVRLCFCVFKKILTSFWRFQGKDGEVGENTHSQKELYHKSCLIHSTSLSMTTMTYSRNK